MEPNEQGKTAPESSNEAPQPQRLSLTVVDPRMKKQIEFARNYVANFNHGAPGHLDLITIDWLASTLEQFNISID